MKARLTILFFVAAFATSCITETGEKRGGKEGAQIDFETKLPTRAAVTSDAAMLAEKGGFTVWAYSQQQTLWANTPYADKTPLLSEVPVTGTEVGGDVIWNYDNPVWWPDGQYVSFFAYGPSQGVTLDSYDANKIPVIDFLVYADIKTQSDLLIAAPLYDQTGPTYSYGQPVNLTFNHALSKIYFSGLLVNNDTREIYVKKVVLSGLYNTGKTALTPISWDVNTAATTNYTAQTATGELKDIPLQYNTPLTLTSDNGYLFLMPQSLLREDVTKDATMTVTLQVTETVNGVEHVSTINHTSPLFTPDGWQVGKSYNYQVVVDGDDIRVIVIDSDITLEPWDVYLMIQPVPLLGDLDKDLARMNSGLSAFVYLNKTSVSTDLVEGVYHFGLYLKNDMREDITFPLSPAYDNGFTEGEQVMFDAKKMIDVWGKDTGGNYYTLKITYDNTKWKLMPSAQPVNTGSGGVDVWTHPTTQNPSNQINNKGSIILERLP